MSPILNLTFYRNELVLRKPYVYLVCYFRSSFGLTVSRKDVLLDPFTKGLESYVVSVDLSSNCTSKDPGGGLDGIVIETPTSGHQRDEFVERSTDLRPSGSRCGHDPEFRRHEDTDLVSVGCRGPGNESHSGRYTFGGK